jgi:hypothetical protein
MPHFFLDLRDNEWSLVRETPSSQKFRVKISGQKELGVDVHYTMPKILTASIAFAGPEDLPRYVLATVLDELAEIVLKTGTDYAVIDYTLVCGGSMTEGNFTIDKKSRRIRKL